MFSEYLCTSTVNNKIAGLMRREGWRGKRAGGWKEDHRRWKQTVMCARICSFPVKHFSHFKNIFKTISVQIQKKLTQSPFS